MQTVVMFDASGEVQRQYIFLYPEDNCGPFCQFNCLLDRTSRPLQMRSLMECLKADIRHYGPLGYTFTCYIVEDDVDEYLI